MTHVLSITNGTTTKTLADGTYCILSRYVPKSSENGEDVTETVEIVVRGSTVADIRAYVNDIQRLLAQASWREKYRQMSISASNVYVNFDPMTSGVTLRSQLRGGRIIASSDTLDTGMAALHMNATIEWTRQGFFEGPETELKLAGTSGAAGATGGRNLVNSDVAASANHNRSFIPAGQVLGDTPAPLKLRISNTQAGSYINEILLGHSVNNENAGCMTLGGEAFSSATSSSVVDATCEGGYYRNIPWTSEDETLLGNAQIGGGTFDGANGNGNRFMIVVRMRDAITYDDLWLRFKIMVYSGGYYTVWEGNLTLFPQNRQMAVIDMTRLPPIGTKGDVTYGGDFFMQLYGTRKQAGTHTIKLDYVLFVPVSGDSGFVRFKNNFAYGFESGETYEYDPYNADDIQGFPSYTSVRPHRQFAISGGPIELFPSVEQYFSVLHARNDGTARPFDTFSVRAYYRPRYNLF